MLDHVILLSVYGLVYTKIKRSVSSCNVSQRNQQHDCDVLSGTIVLLIRFLISISANKSEEFFLGGNTSLRDSESKRDYKYLCAFERK